MILSKKKALKRRRSLFFLSFVALGSFSRVFGTDWKERNSRDFVRVTLTSAFFHQ